MRTAVVGIALLPVLLFTSSGCRLRDKVKDSAAISSCSRFDVDAQSGYEVPLKYTSLGSTELGQSFTPTSDIEVSGAELLLGAVRAINGTTPGVLLLKLEESTVAGLSGEPNDLPIRVSSNVLASSVPLNEAEYSNFTFESPVKLNKGVTYWLRLYASYSFSNTNFVRWHARNDNPNPTGKALYQSSSGGWVDTSIGESRDLIFRLTCAASK